MKLSAWFCWSFATSSLALLEESIVSFTPSNGSISIHDASLVYGADDPVGIEIALNSLAADFEAITGSRPALVKTGADNSTACTACTPNAIIAATADSQLVKSLVKAGKVNVTGIAGKWEMYQTSIVDNPIVGVKKALVIVGSDKRGTIFGVYTLAEQCGQSPFHWWTDTAATQHDEIYADRKTTTFGPPSVKYRGLFINDEAPALMGWWAKVHGVAHQPLDQEFYRHVFDLLLRLKANYLWPGMWKSFVPTPGNIFFEDDPGNQQLADDYGIVVSTSHAEPMQRSQSEWNNTIQGPWQWEDNQANVSAYMREGVQRAGHNESYFTIGMRGDSDSAIEGGDPLEILQEVFEFQRNVFADEYGNATAVNQVWALYKEVATYYAAGLMPPGEDVTLLFSDDNFGNIQRLPLANESERSGGVGIYYHLEYVGIPKSYKWQNTNNLPKVLKELYQAYQRGAHRIWVVNVADIKPLEMPFGFIMDYAWNTSSIDFATIPNYLTALAIREFGPGNAADISDIWMEQSRLIGRRKYESVQTKTYSVLHYHESERVMAEWDALADKVLTVLDALSEERKDAYWHHVQYPILAGRAYYATMLGLGKNQQIGYERRNSANGQADEVRASFDTDFDLTAQYDTVADGKWAGMLAQPHYDQYDQAFGDDWAEVTRDVITGLWYVQMRQNSTYAFGNLGIYAEGSESAQAQARSLPSAWNSAPTVDQFSPTLPPMDPYGKGVWSVELFHRGDYRIPIQWEVDLPYDWITFSPMSGELSSDQLEQQVNVSIDWSAVPENFEEDIGVRINFDTSPFFDLVHLPISNYKAPDDFIGFPETGGIISIEAPHFQRRSDDDVGFQTIPFLGTRSDSGSLVLRPYVDARASQEDAENAWVDYDIYLYNDTDSVTATLYMTSGLDTDPTLPMSYSLILSDDETQANFTQLLETPDSAGDLPGDWRTTVADQVWIRNVTLGEVAQGKHTVRWQTNSPEVYLEKIVLDIRDALKYSYLGPPETTILT
ncbi:glycoside hydrolase family 115 protein [Xylariaceae sp. FL1019]|nr:glycoside hydrolase family 115 protein [Xylariaceae sp. FL1019]